MSDTYYVQMQARRFRRMIEAQDTKGPVYPAYLQGLDEEAFWQACGVLRALLLDYYTAAEADPESLPLPLYTLQDYKTTSKEARDSQQALLGLPCMLLALGMAGRVQAGGLRVNTAAYRSATKVLRVKAAAAQVGYLMDHGFVFPQWTGKAFPAKAECFEVEYPDSPNVLAVMAALGMRLSKHIGAQATVGLPVVERFLLLDPAVFAEDTAELSPMALAPLLRMLPKDDADALQAIVDQFASRGLTLQLDTSYAKNRFFGAKGKDTLSHVEYTDYRYGQDGNEKLMLRLKLNRPDAYRAQVEALPKHLRKPFEEAWCHNCSEGCNRRIVYTIDDQPKRNCGCFAFCFPSPRVEDLDSLMGLYDLEQQARAAKK